MTIVRLDAHPGLSSGPGFTDLAYSTGSDVWPVARVRVTPEGRQQSGFDEGARLHQPNAPTLPHRVVVRLSASLVDGDGQVVTIGGRLLLGPETIHTHQFEAGDFDAASWRDGRAAVVIKQLLRWAEGMASAHAAGLLPAETI